MSKQILNDEALEAKIKSLMKRKLAKYPELADNDPRTEMIKGSIDSVPRYVQAINKPFFAQYQI